MKKKIFALLSVCAVLTISSVSTACSDDDDDDELIQDTASKDTTSKDTTVNDSTAKDTTSTPEEQLDPTQMEKCKELGLNISNTLEEIAAVISTSSKLNPELKERVESNIKKFQELNNGVYKTIVENSIKDLTGLSGESIQKILAQNSYSNVALTVSNLTQTEMNALLSRATSYVNAYKDAKDLEEPYMVIISEKTTYDEKMAMLDVFDAKIKNNYQTSNDSVYKATMAATISVFTGLSKSAVENVVNSDSPKATLIAMYGIKQPAQVDPAEGDTTKVPDPQVSDAQQGQADAKEAVELLDNIKGKSMIQLANDPEVISKVQDFATKYQEGSDEYKQAYMEEAKAQGYTEEEISQIMDAAEKAQNGDQTALLKIANILGIKLF